MLSSMEKTQQDLLFCTLLEALSGVRHELPRNKEHSWALLAKLYPYIADFPVEVIREAAHVMQLAGFLASLEDRGDTYVCGGVSALGGVRYRYYKSATRSRTLGLALYFVALAIIVAAMLYIQAHFHGQAQQYFQNAQNLEYLQFQRYRDIASFIGFMLLAVAASIHRYYYP